MKNNFKYLTAILALVVVFLVPQIGWGQSRSYSYSKTYGYSDLKSLMPTGGNWEDANSYIKIPASSGGSESFTIPIDSDKQPSDNITLTFKLATFGSGNSPSSSNTTITAMGTEISTTWMGSGVSAYPSSSTYVNGVMTLTKASNPTTLEELEITIGVNTGVRIFRLQSLSISYQYENTAPTYSVSSASGISNGSLSFKVGSGTPASSLSSVAAGATVTITASPNSGYELSTISATDAGSNNITLNGSGNTRTFTMPSSNVTVSATFACLAPAAPTFSPSSGAASSVEISCETEGSTIYYTTDGTDPITSATAIEYTSPVSITGSTKIRAISMNACADFSSETSAIFTNYGVTAASGITDGSLLFSVGSGTPASSLSTVAAGATVTITASPNSGYELSTISATDAGSNNITLSGSGNTRTFTMPSSNVTVSATFACIAPSAPTFSPSSGAASSVEISCETEGSTIYYTTDDTAPETSATVIEYTSPVSITGSTKIRAISMNACADFSSETSAIFTNYGVTAVSGITNGSLSFSVGSGTPASSLSAVAENSTVTITASPNPGYELSALSYNDGSDHSFTIGSTPYQFSMPSHDVIVNATFSCTTPANPTFSVASGTYDDVQSVTLSCATSGATIYYTTDGSNPTSSSTAYSSAISVSETTTIKAIAYIGSCSSSVSTATYTIAICSTYVLVTDIDDITEGDYVLCGKNSNYVYAMNSTVSGGRMGRTLLNGVGISDDEISSPGANIIWHLAQSTISNTSCWTLYNANSNVYCMISTSSTSGFSTSSTASYGYTITENDASVGTYHLTTTLSGCSRKIRYYDSGSDFRPYDTGYGSDLYLYKKSCASCPKPTGLAVSNITGHTAVLSWTEKGEATAWQICLNGDESNPIDITTSTAGVTVSGTTVSYTLGGLTGETDYTIKVRANCGDTDGMSDPSNVVSFTTDVACQATTSLTVNNITANSAEIGWTGSASIYNMRYTKFLYGFETAEPWAVDAFAPCTTYDGDGVETYVFSSWDFTNESYTGACIAFNNSNDGSDFMYSHSGDAFGAMFNAVRDDDDNPIQSDDWFILPAITIENGDVFSFWVREITDDYGDEIINVGVYGSTDGTFSSYLAQNVAISGTTWVQLSYDLAGYAGQTIKLAINCVSTDVFGVLLDDIHVGYEVETNLVSPYTITGLTPATEYGVQVQANCGSTDGTSAWSDVATFVTLDECDVPFNLTSNTSPSIATLVWEGEQESYNVQYREVITEPINLTYDFEDGTLQGWTPIDNDGDGNAWMVGSSPHTGSNCARSYYTPSSSSYNANNWLVSPQITLGGEISFYARQYNNNGDERFQVFVSTTGTNISDFTAISEVINPSETYQQYTYSLSGYSGQGYIAIVHTSTTSYAWYIYVDDVTIVKPGEYGSWQTVSDVTSLHTITGLAPETTYEWQVQGVSGDCPSGVTDWSEIASFTTESPILNCGTEDFSGVTATGLYGSNLPAGWRSYGEAPDWFVPHVSNHLSLFDGSNYLLLVANSDGLSSPNCASYIVMPYRHLETLMFDYVYEEDDDSDILEFGYVTDITGYSTWVSLGTLTKSTTAATYTVPASDLAIIRANNGYAALKYSGIESGYNAAGIDNVYACTMSNLWTDAVTLRPDTFPTDATISAGGADYVIPLTCNKDLAWFISYVNGLNGCDPHPTAKAKLTADINMSEYIWVPIGNGTNYFSGSFDGQNHIVSGLHCNVADDCSDQFQNLGMFGMLSGAEVLNLSVSADFANSYFDGSSSNVNTALGVLAGFAGGSSISFCHASGALNSTREMSVGGMVGEMSAASTINASSAAVSITSSDANSYVGGFAGRVYYSHLENSFANSDMTGVTGATVKGNLVGYLEGGDDTHVASANNCYVRNASGKMIGQKSSDYTSTENLYAPTAETGVAVFSLSNYNYGADNNTVGGTPLVDLLNENDGDDDYKWIRAAGSSINGGYPIVVPTGNTTLACVAKVGHKWMRFGELNDMITLYSDSTGYEVFMYNNGMLTGAPSNKLSLYIDENVAMIQSSACNPVTATVSVTLKNYAQNDGSKADVRDWHMFSSSIAAGKTGVVYGSSQGTGETLTFGSDYYLKQGDESVYFPDGITDAIDEPGKQFDLYAFYEPEYHWVNLKRTIDNHWHQDEVEGTGQIEYDGTDNADEASFTKGKGYLIALGDRNGKNNNLMQAKGVLNNVPENAEPIKAYVSNTGNHLTGYNLLGNPFQSYLSFEKFATDNYDVLWNAVPDGEDAEIGTRAYMVYDAKTGGFIEYVSDNHGASFSMGAQNVAGPYIHPHQGFFVVKNTKTGDAGDKRQVIFDNTMRDTEATGVTFRDEVLTYPLVNLHCTDSEGKWEHSVIEFDRPEMAGSLKMKGMLNAKGNMYIHWAGTDFNSLFIDHMPDFVPVWFDAAEDGVFTMTWNTANADFGYMHLIDNIAGVDYDCLANDSYTFNASTTDMSSRFRLVFKPLGIEEETTEQGENFAFVNGNELVVNGTGELNFIDLNGRVLATEYVSGQQSHLTMPNVAEGMYLLRLTNANGVKVQKVIIRK